MPIRRRRAARKPRRKVARRGPRQALTTVNRSLQPIANRYICKMKYGTTVATSSSGSYIFNLNSLFDPDRTGFGHQPYGFDNLATLYNRYRVIACGWRVQEPAGSTGLPLTTSAIASNDLSISWSNTGIMLENPRAKYITQNPGAPAMTLRGKQYIPALVGRTKAQYMADDSYQATVLTSPSEVAVLYLQTFNALSGDAIAGIGLQVLLEYTVEFYDLKHVVQS